MVQKIMFHIYADYNLIQELFSDFEIIDLHQVQEFIKKRSGDKVCESWHYHILIRKK